MVKAPALPTQEIQRIVASDIASGDYYGYNLSMSDDGSVAVITSYSDDNGGGTDAGGAYIYALVAGAYVLEAKVLASSARSSDYFGSSVDVSGDGSTIAIGAYGQDSKASMAGAIYIFTRNTSGVWKQQARLTASDGAKNDYLGNTEISLSTDGNYLAAAAVQTKASGITNAGGVYIYTRTGTTWSQKSKVVAGDPVDGDDFGVSCELSSDATTLVVGACYDDTGANTNAGSIYIYTRAGIAWTQRAKLMPDDLASNDGFGFSSAISGDGLVIAAGSPFEATGGAIYIFKNVNGTWVQSAKLRPTALASGDFFGYSLSLSEDGKELAVGAYGDSVERSSGGAVYLYTDTGLTWMERYKLYSSDVNTSYWFGQCVKLSGDATKLLVGSNTPSPAANSGAAYLFL